jgi:diguanylate cyclase (GGDEF)-like protein
LYGERVRHVLERAEREGVESAVLLMDLDDFKLVNDTLGHDAGDALLREVARRLTAEVRAADTVCRLGGDEFVVIVEDVDVAGAAGLAERLVLAVGAPVELAARTVVVGASIGIALVSHSPTDAGELLRRADVAMYAAKGAGKSGWRMSETMLVGDSGR